MIIHQQDIDNLIKGKLLTMKESKTYPGLYVLKYTRKVFFNGLFDTHPLLMEARGLVVDKDLNIIVHPFSKIFNRNETPEADFPIDTVVKCVRKVNGFMGAVTYNKTYGWIYSTTGSLDSQFCDYIRDYIKPIESRMIQVHGTTYLFEICHPQDPLINEEFGAYLIGIRDNKGVMFPEVLVDDIAKYLPGIHRPTHFNCLIQDVNQLLRECMHEGYVVHELSRENGDFHQTGRSIKMKSPYYLIRKMIARKADLNEALVNAKKIKEKIEEELYCIVDAVETHKDRVQQMNEQERLEFMTHVLMNNIKEYA